MVLHLYGDSDIAYHVSDQYEACFYFSPNHNLRYLFLLTQVSLKRHALLTVVEY